MQFIILFIGAMVFVFYQFAAPPLFFNPVETNNVANSIYAEEYDALKDKQEKLNEEKQIIMREMLHAIENGDNQKSELITQKLLDKKNEESDLRAERITLIKKANPDADTNDTNYIFITFIINFLPVGLIGLLLAAILSASMSSTSAELNALASTTIIDFYKRLFKKEATDKHYLKASKAATVLWGIYAILFALFASQLGSLIEAVNILGSLVYGTILGIFLTAFYVKKVNGTATFAAAVTAETVVLYCYLFTEIPFLWYNVIGCLLVIFLAILFQIIFKGGNSAASVC